jgi:tRNA-specific 2-thiouridylase
MRIAVGMSGGVDSSLAALLLRDEGHEVVGLTAWLWQCEAPSRPRACCGSPEALRRAREAARALGLEHRVVDLSEEFERGVVGPTVRACAEGLTPNPCVLCNSGVRFPGLVQAARRLGAGALATGHYARLESDKDGRVGLLRGGDPGHDQSYFLYAVRPDDLAFSLFPLGVWAKEETRARLAAAGHPAADEPSSQDVCFAPPGGLGDLARARAPASTRPGPVVHLSGEVLGGHSGLAGFTVGQRKGIGVAWKEPLYVIELRPETNELVVGPGEALLRSRFEVERLAWLAPGPGPGGAFEAMVQIRYRTRPTRGRVLPAGEGLAAVELASPVRAVAPGQSAVFYGSREGGCRGGGECDRVLGGGTIRRIPER